MDEFGLPQKIRTDLGGEYTKVWREQHSSNAAVITGASTHNQRIECLWRDVHRCVTVLFVDTFRMLEDEGKLDSLNEVDLFCLHYIYKPRINSTLRSFVESWNNYSMSSEGSLTPTQLYIQGFIETNQSPVQPNAGNLNSQQILARDHAQVPQICFRPCALFLLFFVIDPLQPSSQFGHDIYLRAV